MRRPHPPPTHHLPTLADLAHDFTLVTQLSRADYSPKYNPPHGVTIALVANQCYNITTVCTIYVTLFKPLPMASSWITFAKVHLQSYIRWGLG